MNEKMFPFYWQAYAEEHSHDHMNQSEVDWTKYKVICAKCGVTKIFSEVRSEEYWYGTGWKVFGMPNELPDCFLCHVCASSFYKYHGIYEDLAAYPLALITYRGLINVANIT